MTVIHQRNIETIWLEVTDNILLKRYWTDKHTFIEVPCFALQKQVSTYNLVWTSILHYKTVLPPLSLFVDYD
jgi:hypothetical protein